MNLRQQKLKALSRRTLRRPGALALPALVLCALVSACASSAGGREADQVQRASIEEAWGFRVVRVSLTAGGGMIDLRYQITNPEKAALALGNSEHDVVTPEDLKESPLLIDEDSSYAVMEAHLHLMGRAFKQRETPKAGLTRFMLFGNTKGLVEPGDKVSLAIGDRRLEHMVVQ
jgi:hypothetical protein